ncbi:hypothetical protein AB3A94_001257 [Vibrio alginolyticus]
MSPHIANWKLIKDLANEHVANKGNNIVSLKELERMFVDKFPERNPVNVSMDNTRMLTVNSQSRLSYLYIYGRPSVGKKVRNTHLLNNPTEYPRESSPKNEKDFFVDIGNSLFEIYEPLKHGKWEIVLDANDVNHIEKIS